MIVRNVPVAIAPAAAQRLAELGLDEELDRVIEYTRAAIPTLSEILVSTFDDPAEPAGPRLRILALKDAPYLRRDPERREWLRYQLAHASQPFVRWCTFDLWSREIC